MINTRNRAVISDAQIAFAARRAILGAAVVGVLSASANAIVYRNDVSDALSRGLANQNQFAATGTITGSTGFGGTGTLIAPDWVLTAKHVTLGDASGSATGSFRLGGVTYSGDIYANPANDLSLIHLTSGAVPASTAAPIAPGFFGGEAGKLVWLAGYGGYAPVSGQGNVSPGDGRLRAGTNVVREYAAPFLYFNNENTSPGSTVYESSTAPGDSGGPMFQQINNTWYVVGETFGAGSNGFIHTPTNPNKTFILNTIRGVSGNANFNFATPLGPTALTWDSDVTVDGNNDGSGVWDIQRTNFRSATTGFNYQFDNAIGNDVTFGTTAGTAGTVTITPTSLVTGTNIDGTAGPTLTAPGVTAHNITFNAASSGNYTIASTGGGTLTLATSANSAGDPTITANVDATISAPIVGNTATITKAGSGKLTLSGTNSYTGKLQINAGTLQSTVPASLPGYATPGRVSVASGAQLNLNVAGTGWLSAPATALFANGTFAVGSTVGFDTAADTYQFDGLLPANVSFVKIGPNNVIFTAAQNYVGTTTINTGTVEIANNGHLPTGGTINFADNTTFLIRTNANQTLGAIVAPAANTTANITGGGTLTAASGFTLGSGNGNTFDLSGLSKFVFNQPGSALIINGRGTTTNLAASSTITGSALNIGTGDNSGSSNTTTNAVLGDTTTANVDSLQVGNYHASANVSAPSGSSFTLRGQAGGSSRANVLVGLNTAGAQSQTAALDLRGSNVDARVGSLTVGAYAPNSGSATATGSFSLSGGTVDADAVILAQNTAVGPGSAGTTVGTINQDGGLVRTGSVVLGNVGNTAQGATNQTAVYNLGTSSSAATLQARTIGAGALTSNAGNTTASRTINFGNGTIQTYNDGTGNTDNLTISGANASANGKVGINLASTGTHTLLADSGRTITVANTASFNGAGGLTKAGAGTLRFAGANTYTGSSSLQNGLTIVNGNLASGAVTVSVGASLGGTGSLAGSVASSGTLTPGDGGVGTLGLGALTLADASNLAFDLGTARDLLTTSNLSLGSNVALAVNATAGFSPGTYALIDYSGALANAAALSSWTATGIAPSLAYSFTTGTDAGTGSQAVLLNVTAVPEPAGVAIVSLLGGALFRRRRQG